MRLLDDRPPFRSSVVLGDLLSLPLGAAAA